MSIHPLDESVINFLSASPLSHLGSCPEIIVVRDRRQADSIVSEIMTYGLPIAYDSEFGRIFSLQRRSKDNPDPPKYVPYDVYYGSKAETEQYIGLVQIVPLYRPDTSYVFRFSLMSGTTARFNEMLLSEEIPKLVWNAEAENRAVQKSFGTTLRAVVDVQLLSSLAFNTAFAGNFGFAISESFLPTNKTLKLSLVLKTLFTIDDIDKSAMQRMNYTFPHLDDSELIYAADFPPGTSLSSRISRIVGTTTSSTNKVPRSAWRPSASSPNGSSETHTTGRARLVIPVSHKRTSVTRNESIEEPSCHPRSGPSHTTDPQTVTRS